MRFLKDRHSRLTILVGFLLLILLGLIARSGWLDPLENLLLDLRFRLRGSRPFPSSIVILGIDEASLDTLGSWPWPRAHHGALLKLLRHSSFRPQTVAYDVLFEDVDLKTPQSDEAFSLEAASFGEDLVLAYFFEKGAASEPEARPDRDKMLEKFALPPSDQTPENLEEATKVSLPYGSLILQSSLGFANNSIDPDGRTRRMRLLMRYKDRIYPSLTLLSALKLMGASLADLRLEKRAIVIQKTVGARRRLAPTTEMRIPISASGDMLINYWGAFRELPKFSFLEILKEGQLWMDENREPSKLQSLKDKLVFVGATALGLEDRRVTVFHEYDPAVSVQSQAVANIVEGKFLKPIPDSFAFLISFILGSSVIFLVAGRGVGRALSLSMLLMLGYLFATTFAFFSDTWLDVATPLVNGALLFTVLVSFRYLLTAEELRRTYLQLLHAEKMASLGTLSAGIAHEYRNFLNVIGISVDTCRRHLDENQKLSHSLEIIQTSVDKANQVTEGLLTFARKNESMKTEGRLEKTIRDVLLILEKKFSHSSVEVQKELDEIGPVLYDEGQISQVLMNMLRNAQDALKEREGEKRITVRLKNARDRVLLEIEDNGAGIPRKVLAHLFEPFVTSKKSGEGTGLGLSVCHGIIQSHGGDIKVKTEEGKGTTWKIFLPKT